MSHCCEAARAWARSAAGREFTVCRALPPRPLFAPSAPPRFSPRDPWVLAWLSCTGTAAPLVLSSDSCLTLVFGSDFSLLPGFRILSPVWSSVRSLTPACSPLAFVLGLLILSQLCPNPWRIVSRLTVLATLLFCLSLVTALCHCAPCLSFPVLPLPR